MSEKVKREDNLDSDKNKNTNNEKESDRITKDLTDKGVGKQTIKSIEKQVEKNTGKQAEKSTGKQTEKSTGKQVEKGTGKQAEKSTERQAEKSTGKQAEKSTERQAEKSTGKQAEKNTGKQAEKSAGKQAEKSTGKQAEKSTDKQAGKSTEKQAEKITGKQAEKSTDKQAEKSTEERTDKHTEKQISKNPGTGNGNRTKKQSNKAGVNKTKETNRTGSGERRPADPNRRKRRRRRAVRRKETPFQKYFLKISGPIAFILLIISTVLTVRNVTAGRTSAKAAEQQDAEFDAQAILAAQAAQTDQAEQTAQAETTSSPEPTSRPAALPIPENVPEQDAVAFFTNGIASVDGQSVTILCGGDNLIHEPIYQKAQTDSGYEFSYLYENVKSFIQSADIATINQEAPLATDLEPPSGYPHFNTPKEVGQDLFEAGFDVINIGNNHMYDMGSEGALLTEQYFQNRGIPVVGFYRNDEDYKNIRVTTINGIRVAILSFVEMTNRDPDDPDLGYCVCMEDRDLVKEQIQLARNKADIVVAHAHWGEEGTTELTDSQVEMAHLMVDWGVDIIFGNHPHVIQQLTTITRESDSQICPVIYSMGNFVSAQTHRNQIVSAMLAVKVAKDANGIPRPVAMGVMPVITHFSQDDRMDIVLYPLANYTDELAASHYASRNDGEFSLDYIYGMLSETIPDRYLNRMSSLSADT